MLRRNKPNIVKRVAIGSAIAAVAGYIAGLLTAPKSGKQTRKDIKKAANKGLAEAEKDLKKLNAELDKVISEAKVKGSNMSAQAQKELGKLVEKAKEAKEKTREIISAIHAGEAEDKDLARAVKNGKTAIKNLKTYLKK